MSVEKIARYEIVQEIGKGAMGVVYKAVDPNIGRPLALKTMRLDVHGMEAEEMLKRFRNEARAAGVLNHPNIVTIYDAGEWEGLFYIAMEFIEGISLHQRMREARLTTEEIVDITSQICAGLDYAHDKGVIHRDVKPANIMMAGPIAKIMDFGIAKSGNATMTGTGQVLGTPNYMAPEQVRGKPLDGRSDLFGVGVILYELITGERPFTGENVTTIVYKIVHENPIPPRDLDVTIHPGLSAVVLKALEKAPESRYQSGAELAKALQSYKAFGVDAPEPTTVLDEQIQQAVSTGVLPPSALTGSMLSPASTGSSSVRTPAPMQAVTMSGAAPAPAPAPVSPATDSNAPPPPPTRLAMALSRPAPLPRPVMKGAKPGPPVGVIAALTALLIALLGVGYWKFHKPPAPPVAQQQNTTQPAAPVRPATTVRQQSQPAGAAESTAEVPASEESKPAGEAAAGTSKGYLEVTSDPAGAAIVVDGQPSGQVTPNKIEVNAGPHRVVLQLSGYGAETVLVNVGVGQTLNLTPKLSKPQEQATATAAKPADRAGEPPFDAPQPVSVNPLSRVKRLFTGVPDGRGVIEIRTRPKGADVWINRFEVPARSPVRMPIKPGSYTVTVRMPGYKALTKAVEVKEGSVVPVDVQLEKQ
ncbi:MAG TPA: protein kinase [Terriglobales bacterium]|nr:protein kinase [Terriglobales bacterium]